MAQIVTITNPLTGQPAQVDQLEHTAQEIDDAIARALPGGEIDITLANKAPDGYGLGGNAAAPTTNDADSCTLTGWYAISSMSNCPFTYGLLRVEKWYDGCIFQTAYEMSSGVVAQRRYQNSEWKPWEYVNPPMTAGVEYRTTERCKGKPVYAKLLYVGNIGKNSSVTVCFENDENNRTSEYIVYIEGYSFNNNRYFVPSKVSVTDARANGIGTITLKNADTAYGSDANYVWVKYTKKTD